MSFKLAFASSPKARYRRCPHIILCLHTLYFTKHIIGTEYMLTGLRMQAPGYSLRDLALEKNSFPILKHLEKVLR